MYMHIKYAFIMYELKEHLKLNNIPGESFSTLY